MAPAVFETVIKRGEDTRTQFPVFPLFETEAVNLAFEVFQERKRDLVASQPQAYFGEMQLQKEAVAAARGRGHGPFE